MITDHDRSGWIGASDTLMVMGDWGAESFTKWWRVKLGLETDAYTNARMRAGTAYEHRVLEHMGVAQTDRQILCERLRLRVNLDGEERGMIHEVKTYGKSAFRVTAGYWMQCEVEMFATSLNRRKRKTCQIDAYRLLPQDYRSFANPIDPLRLSYHPIAYNPGWVDAEYLPRLRCLARCLETGEIPNLLMLSEQRWRLRSPF